VTRVVDPAGPAEVKPRVRPIRPPEGAGHTSVGDAHVLLSLQRLAGNAATTALVRQRPRQVEVMRGLPVQRALVPPGFAASLDGTEQARLTAIANAVGTYNLLDQNNGNGPGLQPRFAGVTQLERVVYGWYDSKRVPDLTDNADAALGGNATAMTTLLRGLETERDAVVTAMRTTNTSITFAGAAAGEIGALQNLWVAIINQTGHLRVVGNAAEVDKLFSQVAAILQTPTGRSILEYMVNRSPNVVSMMESTQANLQQVAVASGAPPTDRDKVLNNRGTSFAGAADLQGSPALVRDQGAAPATAVTTAPALISGVVGAAPPTHYTAGGERYRPGTGRAGFAAVASRPALDAGRSPASDAAGNEVLTPSFITLLHELGHALKIATGTYMPASAFAPELTRQIIPNAADEDFWPASTLEEFVNVTGVENPVRAESGISARDVYETPEMTRVIRLRQQYAAAWSVLRAADNPDAFDYLAEVPKRCDRQYVALFRAMNIFDSVTVVDVANRINPVLAQLNPAAQLAGKQAFITQARADFINFMAGLSAADQVSVRRTQRYLNLNTRLDNLVTHNQTALGVRQADVRQQVNKFILDRNQLIAAGKKIHHVRFGAWSPANWGSGKIVTEGTV
jgi:hypothetical protein